MSKKSKELEKEKEQNRVKAEEVIETMHKAEAFFLKNKNPLIYGLVGIVVVVGGLFAYREFVSKPKNKEAAAQMYKAQNHFAKDSFRLALYGDGTMDGAGFEQIAEEYGSTDAGNLANFCAGVCCLQIGEYEKGIEFLERFKSDDEVLAPRALANIGDCYVEIENYEQALKYFLKAAKLKENNLAAKYLMKATAIYEKNGNYAEALKLYQEIKTKYADSSEAQDVDKYIEHAKVLSAN
ncbi:MAG: tetratricopeptide repeat protein [Prevotellaceae bacterium]|jgi:tetratricopeptide (TPR) repeat protein|nr:tetratricopeptide repeat protein [Prevotellaceae bacterium]